MTIIGSDESICKILHLGSENERLKYQVGVTMLEMTTSEKESS